MLEILIIVGASIKCENFQFRISIIEDVMISVLRENKLGYAAAAIPLPIGHVQPSIDEHTGIDMQNRKFPRRP